MKFNSQICTTRSQSERLLALGLKKETADMTLQTSLDVCYTMSFQVAVEYFENRHLPPYPTILPAWSLHKLIMMMPSAVYQGDSIRYFMIDQGHNVGYWYFGEDECELCKVWSRKDLYNNIIDCIEWLIKEGYFNKEYLEE